MNLTRRRAITLAAPSLVLVAAACQTAPAAPEKPAAAAAPASTATKLILAADLVQGSKNIPTAQAALKSCSLQSRFPRNSEMVWRIRVYDPRTGNLMDKTGLSKVEVKLANGKNLDADFGPHPKDPPNESYWTASWVVPKDAPTGTLKFTVAATATDGRTGAYEPFAVVASLPSILDEVLADAPPKA